MTATGLGGVDAVGDVVDVVVGLVDGAGDVAGVPLAVARGRRGPAGGGLVGPALVQLGDGHPLDALDVELVLAPGGHAAGEVAGDVAQADGGGERRGLDGVLVVAADEHDGLLGLGQPRELGAEPRAARGDAQRAGDVRLVELQLGAHVDDERPVVLGLLDLARAERVRLDGLLDERAAVERDDVLEVRRLRAQRRRGPLDELVLVGDLQQRPGCARSNPMVEETLRSMPGPPHSEPPRCPGHTSTVSGRLMSLSLSEWKMPRAPSSLSTARSGRAMSPTNSVSPLRTAHGSSDRARCR